jgi:CubicO group peptidase (beta-lactamase class C family)
MKKINKLASAALASILALLSGCATGTSVPDTYKAAAVTARSEIWKDINSGKAGSATVAIMDHGSVVYAEGFGMADREKSIPVDPDTRFNMGSISKMYCAAAVMLLVDDGKLKLDDPVVKHLPEFKMADERYKNITIRMLLNHTCALPGTSGANNFGHAYNPDIYKDTLAVLSRAHLMRNPGELPIYCNDGFTLAEIVVVRVSGMKFMDFVHERICKPLALRNTYLSVGDVYCEACVRSPAAAAFYEPDTAKREPLECLSVLGAGGLGTTAIDLCLFADTFSDGGKQIFSPSSLAEMKKVQPGLLGGGFRNP